MTQYLEPEQVIRVVGRLGFHVRDRGLLFAALARPATSLFGADAYDTLELKAAALFSSVARSHALLDGNKRLSWVLTVAFLNVNGYDLDMTADEKFDLVLAVAQDLLDLEAIASTLAQHLIVDRI